MSHEQDSPAPAEQDPNAAPLYTRVNAVLRRALVDGRIPAGLVLLEGPLAELLHTTRTPVRQALRELEEEGLAQRFEGRGMLALPPGSRAPTPLRQPVTAEMLALEAAEPLRKTLRWEAIYDEVEREVVHLSVFGRQRVNEVALAQHFGVGRMAARDVLLRLESLGLLEKDDRQRWVVTALDTRRIANLYELRALLEPAALRAAAARARPATLAAMREDLHALIDAYPRVSREAMDALETALHIDLLSHCPNTDLLQSLQRTRCILTLSKHALGSTAPMPRQDPFMAEHLAVLDALAEGDAAGAAEQLRQHLENSCAKVTRRVAQLRSRYAVPDLPYIG